MALSKLSGDEQRILFTQLRNVLDPYVAVALSCVSHELREPTQALLPQLRADHEAAAALCLKVGLRSCKELREAKEVHWRDKGLTAADLALLGTLGSLLPALETLELTEHSTVYQHVEPAAGPDGMQRLVAGLGAGALPAVTELSVRNMHVGDAGASALAAALGRGALPLLEILRLGNAAIGDAGLVALAPALRRLPALEALGLSNNPLGDEGIAALMAPPPAGAPPPPTGGLKQLKWLDLDRTQITDASCATLAAALDRGALLALEHLYLYGILDNGALPALEELFLHGIPASAAAIDAVYTAREMLNQ